MAVYDEHTKQIKIKVPKGIYNWISKQARIHEITIEETASKALSTAFLAYINQIEPNVTVKSSNGTKKKISMAEIHNQKIHNQKDIVIKEIHPQKTHTAKNQRA